MAGLPFSGCESGRLREAPTGTKGLRARGNRTGGTPDLRFRTCPGGKRDFGQRAATGGEGASASDLSGRTGLRPGSCETGRTQDFGPWTCQAEPRLRPRIPPDAEPRLRPEEPPRREEERKFQICQAANRQGFGPDGEPAGKPDAASAADGPRRKRTPGAPGSAPRPRNRPARNASPPRLGSTRRDSGGRRQRRPPLLLGWCDGAARRAAIVAPSPRFAAAALDLAPHGRRDSSRRARGRRRIMFSREHARASPPPSRPGTGAPGLSFIGPETRGQRRSRHRRPSSMSTAASTATSAAPSSSRAPRASSPATSTPTRRGSPAPSKARSRRAR